jgi:type III pantothenate kinase
MLLTIDVGNSQTVVGVFDGEELGEHWRVSTSPWRTADEHALQLDGVLGFAGLGLHDIGGVAVCSVVPQVTERLREMAARQFSFRPVIVGPGIRTGVAIQMDDPREVGADRLVNSLAAYELHGGPGIVVDFGTATSFDVYTAKGAFIGGAIAPGVRASMDALSKQGAQLRTVELTRPRNPIGRNTVEAMQSGAVYGFAGLVDRVVEELSGAMGAEPVVVATGGLAGVVASVCRSIERHEPWLTLLGLRVIWERNQG